MKFKKKNDVWIKENEEACPHISESSSSSDLARPSSSAPAAPPSSPIPIPTSGSVAEEHHLTSPHTPIAFPSFSIDSVVEQVMGQISKKLDDMFSDLKLQFAHNLEE